MEEITRVYLKKWQDKQEIIWFEEFKQLTFDIASELLLGTKPGVESAKLSKLFTTLISDLFFPEAGWKPQEALYLECLLRICYIFSNLAQFLSF